jgi:hypothetical protein
MAWALVDRCCRSRGWSNCRCGSWSSSWCWRGCSRRLASHDLHNTFAHGAGPKIAVAIEFHCYHLPVSQWRILRRVVSPGRAIERADAAGVWKRAALIACDRDKSIA